MQRLPFIPLAAIAAVLALHSAPVAAQTDYSEVQLKADLKLFEGAKLPHDDQDLIKFFERRLLPDKDRERIAGLIERLSSKSFKEREQSRIDVIKEGPQALPLLREVMHNSVELEVKMRAENCLKAIEKESPSTLVLAAARILKQRRAEGAVPVLMEFVAIAPDENIEEELFASIYSLALVGAKLEVIPPAVKAGAMHPQMVVALADKDASRRAIAALVVARYGDLEQRKNVAKLLNDQVAAVRFRAAQGLILARDLSGVPVLLEMVDKAPMHLALQAEDLLSLIAQEKSPSEPLAETPELRQKCLVAWKEWWNKNKGGLDLSKIEVESPFGGVVARARNGAVQFVKAIELLQRKKDLSMLTNVTDVPFTFLGQITFKTRQEFDDFVKMALMNPQPKEEEFKAKIIKVVPGGEYAKGAPEAERAFLEASRLAQVHVVYTTVQEGANQQEDATIPLFIRISGGRARCIGFGLPAMKQ
jgi:HEAT repeat protein